MKRFYKTVSVAPEGAGWRVLLDGRPIRTQGGQPQAVPTRALAEAMAQEWTLQGEDIDTAAFAMRDLADYAIDAVGPARAALVDELAAYGDSDTLCYRADPDEPLYARQMEVWEPLLTQGEARWGVSFRRISGIIHRSQPDETLERMHKAVAAQDGFTLAAMRMLTSLSASLVIALAAIEPDADAQALWNAAILEEQWQAGLWGRDDDAEENRKTRFEAFALAMRFARLAREDAQA